MSYEIFKPLGHSAGGVISDEPFVAFGDVRGNLGTRSAFLLGKPERVVVLVDRSANKLAFRAPRNGEKGLGVSATGKRSAYRTQFSSCAIIRTLGISKLGRYRATWNAEEKMIEVDLNQEPE